MRAATANSPRAKGRQGQRTDASVVSAGDFAKLIEDLDGSAEHYNIMLYGDSGCGKTVVAGSAPNSLILACEPGYISAARVSLGNPVGRRKVARIPNGATLLGALDHLEAGAHSKYEWIILEGASTLDYKVRLGYAQEAFDNNPESRTHRNLPDKPDYFNTQNYMRSAITRLVDLPCHVLVTAHAMRFDDDAGDRLVLPNFQQKEAALSNYVSGLMHSVGFMRKRISKKKGQDPREVRRILWQQTVDPASGTIYFAKDQLSAFGRYTDDTNMGELIALADKAAANAEVAEEPVETRKKRRG